MVNVCVNWCELVLIGIDCCERSCLIDGYGCGSKGYTPVGLH